MSHYTALAAAAVKHYEVAQVWARGAALLAPSDPSLCWDVKVGWVPVRDIDPATGRRYVIDPGSLQPVKESLK